MLFPHITVIGFIDLKCAARGSLEMGRKNDAKIAICALPHNFVGLESSQLRHISTIGKNN